jgi:hypothetical protein
MRRVGAPVLLAAMEAAVDAARQTASSLFTAPVNSRAYRCSAGTCARPAYAKGLCNAHYLRQRAGRPLDEPLRARKREDACAQCGEKTGAKGGWGLCASHYRRARAATIKDALISCFGGHCARCTQPFPRAAFDFHHADADKDAHPSGLIASASLNDIAEEVAKCVLLCANCHRIEHADDEVLPVH